METMQSKYARLLVDYCLEIKKRDRLFIRSTTLAEPLVREVYRLALRRGAHVVTEFSISEQSRIFYEEADESQLAWISPLLQTVMEDFDAYLYIRAPFNLREEQDIAAKKRSQRGMALKKINEIYNQRTADRSMKRCLCQYPTQAAAQEAGMSLESYEHFVFKACKLYDSDPSESWREVRRDQQRLVDYLDKVARMQYIGQGTDLTFATKGRKWINSDGKTNMPSGEVFSSPIEDSVDGVIHFSYPSIYLGQPVEGITLTVKGGQVVEWKAKRGMALLDQIFATEGADRFGEVAIGTNYDIQRATHNILFDEKIGGTVHMAVGQSYIQTGGMNNSPIHWDMIAEMKNGGQIIADGKIIYENGIFLI